MVVLFDVDDTLLDHCAAIRAATCALHKAADIPISPDEFLDRWQDAHRRYYPKFLAGQMAYTETARHRIRETIDPTLSDREADNLFRGYLEEYERGWSLFPDVLPCLDRLGSTPVGIVSNGRSDEQRRKLAVTGIAGRFDYVAISEDCGFPKPNPEMFRRACEAMGIAAHEAAYVGDQYELDACAARAAGLVGIWLDRAGVASSRHHAPVIKSLCDLEDVVSSY